MATDVPPTYRVTSFEVAERAGVNQSTVSRALSGDPSITDQTRARVQEAADALGYRVDARAARLRSGKTRTIAIVVIARTGMDVTEINPFHYNLLGSTCAAASSLGYQSLVSFQSEPEHFDRDFIETRQADGMVLLGTSANDAAWEYHHPILDRKDVASWGSRFTDHDRTDSDNRQGTRIAVERLMAGGHRKLAFIGDISESQNQFRERFESYCEVLKEAGLDCGKPVFESASTRMEQGRRSAADLIESGRDFDGIFCASDSLALGVLDMLRERGIAVPDDVGVIGFDGLDNGAYSYPPLTSVEPDFREAGMLLAQKALGKRDRDDKARVPVKLIERDSVRKPAKG
ncbi:LacI family DNA-binding transcriptional regulator [Erythrobacter alti]|uniref:LacI family DNA-binding transcriptional regulator n=1 Tax=Erythrobacter alti TaxID=1896145 RepID=UPI0030F4086A